ncbi:MAG: hypothetical protein ACD_75C00456G0002 [uncultured bacterium]|nr:MAG: hypothetical protein ACD_75C00456G0002 [uncultured bacterium]
MDQPATAEPERQSGGAAKPCQHGCFKQKQKEDMISGGTEGAEQAYLPGPFTDGDSHDRKDADAAHQKGDPAQATDDDSQHAQHRAQNIKHLLLSGDGEILLAVAMQKHSADGGNHFFGFVSFPIQDIYLHQPFTVKKVQSPLRRQVDGVVHFKTEELPLRLHGTDDPRRQIADLNTLSERIAIGEKFLTDFVAQHHKGPCQPGIIGWQ